MPRKVFISFLGTGNYVECYYDINKENPVRFVQESLIRTICKDWAEDDRIYIFCTEDAEKKNWVDNGQERPVEEIDKIGLESRLNKLNIKAKIEKVRIGEGFSEESVWSIFNTVYGKLNEGDSIYFDVTHAFRSIPIFSVVLFNYSRVMKNTKIEEIKYGAFEKLGPAFEVRKKPLEERGIAPVLDLTNIVRLQEYNEMASSLHYFGKTKMLTAGLRNENDENQMLTDLCRSITELDEYIATNQLTNIREGRFIARFRINLPPVARTQTEPIRKILQKIKSETSGFVEGRDNKNIEAAIDWAKKHEMLAQTYSLAEEYIVLRVAEHFAQFNPFGKDSKARKNYREFISAVLGLPEKKLINGEFHGIIEEKGDLVRNLRQEEFIQKLIPCYEKIRLRRNSIIHGNGEYSYSDLEESFSDNYNACISIINEYDKP